jgi:hypothetical protein
VKNTTAYWLRFVVYLLLCFAATQVATQITKWAGVTAETHSFWEFFLAMFSIYMVFFHCINWLFGVYPYHKKPDNSSSLD